MKIIQRLFDEAYLLQAEPIQDSRGTFTRLYCENELRHITGNKPVVQINHAHTRHQGVIRGMHFQKPPKEETKLIRCIQGAMFNVIVDLRAGSPTFLQWHGQLLTEDNNFMVYIPSGFAHGSQILADNTGLVMFHTDFYSREHEGGIRYDEPLVGISWPMPVTELSEKDRLCPYLDKHYKGIELTRTN